MIRITVLNAICLIFFSSLGFSGTIYVRQDAVGANDGSSWTDAFTDLQTGINTAVAGDEVWVAAGTYKPTSWPNGGSTEREKHFSLKNDVTVYGGFVGTESFLFERNVLANETICSGDYNGDDIYSEASPGVFEVLNNSENSQIVFHHKDGLNLNATASLDGLVIVGGTGGGGYLWAYGGGMLNVGCSPSVSNCTFKFNRAAVGGGITNLLNSKALFTNCRIINNVTSLGTGGIYNKESDATFVGCTINNNYGWDNGGVLNESCSPHFVDTEICYNRGADAAGVWVFDASPLLSNCTIKGNIGSAYGGGVKIEGNSSPSFENCTIDSNVSDWGGGICVVYSQLEMTNCTISNNQSTGSGGGIFNGYGVASLINCTITGNTANNLGGGYVNSTDDNSMTSLVNCTLSGNDAGVQGGGVHCQDDLGIGTLTLTNCIIWGNTAPTSPEISGDAVNMTYSVIQGGYAGTGNVDSDPNLGILQDNGGPVNTQAIDVSSVAFDSGTATGAPLTDARGYKRQGLPDIGAFEAGGLQPFTVTFSSAGNGILTGDLSQLVYDGEDATTVTAVPDVTYALLQWTDGGVDYSTVNPLTITGVSSDMDLVAHFTNTTYTLAYAVGLNGSISGPTPQTVLHGSDGSLVTAVPDTGYHFTAWSDGLLSASRKDNSVTADIDVTASFAINTYNLTYTAGAGGSITGSLSQVVDHGSDGSPVTAVPLANHHFVIWSDGVSTGTRTDLGVTSNLNVTALFAIDTYSLNYSANPNGSISGATSQTIDHGSDGNPVTAVPNVGYHFVQWSDGITTAARTDTAITADLSVTATFAINTYTLTYSAGPNGTLNGTTVQTIDHGANATTVTAVPDVGYRFVEWDDGVMTASRTDVGITSARTVVASFKRKSSGGGGGCTVGDGESSIGLITVLGLITLIIALSARAGFFLYRSEH